MEGQGRQGWRVREGGRIREGGRVREGGTNCRKEGRKVINTIRFFICSALEFVLIERFVIKLLPKVLALLVQTLWLNK